MTNPRNKRDIVSKINRVPRALQSLLGNVNQGVNPHELNHGVSPGVDLYPHWAVDRLQMYSDVQSIAGVVGQGLQVAVPEGKIWQVVAASISKVKASAATEYDLAICIGKPNFVPFLQVFQRQNKASGVTGGDSGAGGPFPDRFFLPSGWVVRGQVLDSNNVPNTNMTLMVMYHEFSV